MYQGIEGIGFNKGGMVDLGGVKVMMVNVLYSLFIEGNEGLIYVGYEFGYMIVGDGYVIYVLGDIDIMVDMVWMGEYYQFDIGILCVGGYFIMDMKCVVWVVKKYFDFKMVVFCYYKIFFLLE